VLLAMVTMLVGHKSPDAYMLPVNERRQGHQLFLPRRVRMKPTYVNAAGLPSSSFDVMVSFQSSERHQMEEQNGVFFAVNCASTSGWIAFSGHWLSSENAGSTTPCPRLMRIPHVPAIRAGAQGASATAAGSEQPPEPRMRLLSVAATRVRQTLTPIWGD
jgi:hypothetical protein